jgi:hypothetical protein
MDKIEEKPAKTGCPRTDCVNNVCSYCQITPELEVVDGRKQFASCLTFRVKG